MHITGIKTRLFREKESLIDFITEHIKKLNDGDVVVITSKVLALAQGRVTEVKDKEQIIRSLAKKAIKTQWAFVTLTEEGWNVNAGVDESNADSNIILLPEKPYDAAHDIRKELMKYYGVKKLGVLITDTRSVPLRKGTVGRAIGLEGFEPLKSYVDQKDLFGRKSRFTVSNMADALSAAAVAVMGEGDERIPLAVISDAPVKFTVVRQLGDKKHDLSMSPEDDIYSIVFDSRKNK